MNVSVHCGADLDVDHVHIHGQNDDHTIRIVIVLGRDIAGDSAHSREIVGVRDRHRLSKLSCSVV